MAAVNYPYPSGPLDPHFSSDHNRFYDDLDPIRMESNEKATFDQSFQLQRPKFNDLWAGILFLIFFGGFVAVSGISLQGYAATKGFNGGGIYDSNNDFGLDTNTVVLFVFCVGSALILSYGYVLLARFFTKQLIWITGILNIVWGFATAIYMLSRHYWSGGIVFLIFSIFFVFAFLSWIKRIPFSVLMLQTAIDVSRNYGHVYLVSLIGGLAAAGFGAWYSITLVAVYVKYEPGANPACRTGAGDCSTAKVIGLLVFITFTAYWVTEVLKNLIHTTISGVYGSWYFYPRSLPSGPTRGAFRRATTYSFGSISLGSLVVAIINFLRQLCSIAQQNEAQGGDVVGAVFFCFLQCIIGLLDWAVQFLNRYAFSHIALYGKSYIPAARDTWRMIRDRGIDAIVNECLIGPVFGMGSFFVAFFCGLLSFLYVTFTHPAYNRNDEFTPVIVAFAFVIGLQMCNIMTTPLSSGIDTIFVGMAWDPEVMRTQHPDLWDQMVTRYPKVQQAIMA
ncbi:MAG: putative choline transporter, neither null mutation nor overexpression affects choline transport [Bathelium mastoideum]|nr:MAG: putative choline transporter, neither null mutation nor overexpression affects choline transport [Bathelium mastoideum]